MHPGHIVQNSKVCCSGLYGLDACPRVVAAVSPSVSLTPPPPFYSPNLTTSPAATTRGLASRPYSPEQQTLQEAIQKSLLPKKKVTNNTKRKAKVNDIQEKPAKKKVNAGKEYK